ncbi:type III PLP-dependent enzyme [Polaromonas sp.]|nr:type III PLP-dependent enzyme [Candidatus Saccharibacteria bacterium]
MPISSFTPAITEKLSEQLGSIQLHRITPYIVTDINKITKNLDGFAQHLPDVGVYYAIKANRDLPVLRAIDSDVRGFDIASLGELNLLMKIGIDPSRIFFSNPVKIPRHVKAAYKMGVRYYAFDSVNEIAKLAKYAPGSNVYLRLKVSDNGSKFPLSKKFGLDALYAADYCSLAQDAGLNVMGITFHVGSQSENLQAWQTAIELVGKTIDSLEARDIHITMVNLGGGFPADYGEPIPLLKDIAGCIKQAQKDFLPENVELMAEPGRYVVANSSVMVTSVIGREHRSGSDWLYLDVGTFQGLIEPLEMPGWKYPVWSNKRAGGSDKSFVLTGPTCDAYDTIGFDYTLPSDLTVGDKIYIGAVGAYTSVYATRFNGFLPPKTYYIGLETNV